MRLCSVDGCGQKHKAIGFCTNCYAAAWRNACPERSLRLSISAAERTRRHNRTSHGRFLHSRRVAIKKGVEWALTEPVYAKLTANPCGYCGGPLAETGIALDRANNALGYIEGNVIPCCAYCNTLRGSILSVAETWLLVDYLRVSAGRSTAWEGVRHPLTPRLRAKLKPREPRNCRRGRRG